MCYKTITNCQVQWLKPVTSALWRQKLGIQAKVSKILSQLTSWARWCKTLVPATMGVICRRLALSKNMRPYPKITKKQ
jgi:hypothetical protein